MAGMVILIHPDTLEILASVGSREPWTFDPKMEQFSGDDEANKLVGREYRAGHWAVPKAG